jgi:hypothetical protein
MGFLELRSIALFEKDFEEHSGSCAALERSSNVWRTECVLLRWRGRGGTKRNIKEQEGTRNYDMGTDGKVG